MRLASGPFVAPMKVPVFPDFKEIELGDRDEIAPYLERCRPETSELTFTSLFMWRKACHTAWCRLEKWLLFLERRDDGTRYFLPPVGEAAPPELIAEMLAWLRDALGEPLAAIERTDHRFAVDRSPWSMRLEKMPEHSDYVYSRDKLAGLAGRRLSSKRNLINQLKRDHGFVAEEMHPGTLADCRRVVAEWLSRRRKPVDAGLLGECRAALEVLDHFRALPVQGRVVRVRGRVEAFSVSEALNRTTRVVQIEKATGALPGLYPALTQCAAQGYPQECDWVNRAQDLGIPGLRVAKAAWRPDRMVEKFRIRLESAISDRSGERRDQR